MSTRRAIYCLALGQTIVWAGIFYVFAALLPRWELVEGWSKTGLGATFAGAIALSALASPSAGRLVDRGAGPQLLAGAALLGALGVGLLPLAPSLTVFAALWLVIGLAMAGALYEPCFAVVTRCLGAESRRAITTITLFAGFASSLAFPAGHILAETGGWPAATTVAALATALLAAPLLWIGAHGLERAHRTRVAWQTRSEPEDAKARDLAEPGGRIRETVMRRPAFVLLAVSFSGVWLGHGIVIAHILPILDARGVTPASAVLFASLIGPMQVAGRVIMRVFEDRLHVNTVTMTGFVAMIAGMLSLLLAGFSTALLLPFVFLHGAGYGVMSVMRPVSTRMILGEAQFGAISGAIALPTLLAAAAAPFIGAVLWQLGGYDLAILTVCAAFAAGLGAYIAAARASTGAHDPN
ncbi:MAG: MFS transporter [Pseudomonadota bacterium]